MSWVGREGRLVLRIQTQVCMAAAQLTNTGSATGLQRGCRNFLLVSFLLLTSSEKQ